MSSKFELMNKDMVVGSVDVSRNSVNIQKYKSNIKQPV